MTANLGSNTVESSTTEMIRRPPTKSSEHRRITKPIMEKKRRARINNSLNELKVLILEALNKDPSRHSKLEKADILEMTVRHLQKLQRQQVAATIVNDASVLNKYRAGFSECASEVGRYINHIEGFDQTIRQSILSHLTHCVNGLNQMAANAQFGIHPHHHHHHHTPTKTAFPGMMPSNGSLHVHIPMHHPAGSSFGQVSGGTHINSPDINNNRACVHDEMKPNLSTPPSSASSTSSHFAFSLNLNSPNKPISLTAHDMFYHRNQNKNYHHNCSLSLSPGSFVSEEEHLMSPTGCSDDLEMNTAVDCTVSKSIKNNMKEDENVWRPW